MLFTRKKVFIIEVILIALVLFGGITYSLYTSEADIIDEEIEIAQFVFNANKINQIEIPLSNLIPGNNVEYQFSVANNLESKVSEVTVEYQIIISTIHAIPLTYELIHVTDTDEVILTCNETTPRNAEGELECKSPVMQMNHVTSELDNYKLNILFPSIYNDSIYANLVDYVDIEISSWQKTE